MNVEVEGIRTIQITDENESRTDDKLELTLLHFNMEILSSCNFYAVMAERKIFV